MPGESSYNRLLTGHQCLAWLRMADLGLRKFAQECWQKATIQMLSNRSDLEAVSWTAWRGYQAIIGSGEADIPIDVKSKDTIDRQIGNGNDAPTL